MAAKAEVEYDAAKILPNQIANSISDLGFPSAVIEDESGAGIIELEVLLFLGLFIHQKSFIQIFIFRLMA